MHCEMQDLRESIISLTGLERKQVKVFLDSDTRLIKLLTACRIINFNIFGHNAFTEYKYKIVQLFSYRKQFCVANIVFTCLTNLI